MASEQRWLLNGVLAAVTASTDMPSTVQVKLAAPPTGHLGLGVRGLSTVCQYQCAFNCTGEVGSAANSPPPAICAVLSPRPPSTASSPPRGPAAAAAGAGASQLDPAHTSGADGTAAPAARDSGAGGAAVAAEGSEAVPGPSAAGQLAAAEAAEEAGVCLGGGQGAAAAQGGAAGGPPPALHPWLAERVRVVKEAVRGCALGRPVFLLDPNVLCAQGEGGAHMFSRKVIMCPWPQPALT